LLSMQKARFLVRLSKSIRRIATNEPFWRIMTLHV
jgi:hypothetical protein